MNPAEKNQIEIIIRNFHESKQYVPYFTDLKQHETFWVIFNSLEEEQVEEVKALIKKYIREDIANKKTKWGELFKRFFDLNEAKFWDFRLLNDSAEDQENENFQKLGKEIENELFKYEGILTEKMLQQEKGLDKVLGSFYNIVYSYFPKMNLVK